ncbi:hypothetical protein K2173_009268 [Erythroxylum novogranatense]|uniref:AP-5 complex subunit beta-1 n=1 Tax=Erythroxylum novogranatense TaxID=1862640 RepID=A0AAV8SYQ5_9ROSI|nr:hypothetical protein K2173_009268 [Erythroxylum novogranatense]
MTDHKPSTPPPPLKPASPQEWESLIDDFQNGGPRFQRWTLPDLMTALADHAIACLLKKDFPPKLSLLIFLEEFAGNFFTDQSAVERLLETIRATIHAPLDGVNVTYLLKEQFLVSTTSIFISIDALARFDARCTESLVELLLTIINRPNHGPDRQTRAVACECLRELEKCYPCLLSEVGGHVWSLCQSERCHASQSYILLFTSIIYSIVNNHNKCNVSILNTSVPLVPFNVPQSVLVDCSGSSSCSNSNKEVSSSNVGLNYKELRRAMAFLLESPQILTPCGMVEFLGMIIPVVVALELQASLLKVQFFGMIYSFDPLLCHVVLVLYSNFFEAFDGQEEEIARRLMLVSRESHHYLVFRLLALHWLLGLLSRLMLRGEVVKYKSVLEMGLRFYPAVFDPLALKALKVDLLAFCSVCLGMLIPKIGSGEEAGDGKSVVKLFEESLVSVSAFKWLPPWSTETAVAFHAFHKFLIGASSHTDIDPSTTKALMDSTIFCSLQSMLVDLTLEFQRWVPVIVSLIDRFLGCRKHCWLGERLLQTIDERLLARVIVDYKLVSYFPILDRIAANKTIPPHALLDLLLRFMIFLVEKHGPHTGLRSWSKGSKVLSICRTLLMHHHSSRLFLGLCHLLTFTCLYFPDLEIRDSARIYLRMLITIPGLKLRSLLNFGDQLLGISPSSHASSFFSVQSQPYPSFKKSRRISSYIHIERLIPLLVKQYWSLSLSPLGGGTSKPIYPENIRDSEPHVDLRELDSHAEHPQTTLETRRTNRSQEPLRVMDSKISEILKTLRRHFSCIPDFRHMPGIKVRISCSLRFESEPFNQIWVGDSQRQLEGIDDIPAMYAIVLKFSSSAPYGSIPSHHIPVLFGEPPMNSHISDTTASLDIISADSCSEDESSRAPVTIDLVPGEPSPGLVDVFIEATAENGQVICGQLQSITVGIEDMFAKAILPSGIPEDAVPTYYSELFDALWEACGASSNMGHEVFPLKGGRGAAAISGTQSVKLLEVAADSVIRAVEEHLTPFVVNVISEQLVNIVKDGGVIRNIMWKNATSESFGDDTASCSVDRGPLHLTYIDDKDDKESGLDTNRSQMGCFHVLIFLPPRFHLLFQMEVRGMSTLVRIRTDHWPCLAYIDEYLEALFLP